MLTIKDLMRIYQVSRKTIYNWIDKGMPVTRVGAVVRFDPVKVRTWVDEFSEKGEKGVI